MNIALIFAGGVGSRMNTKAKPKQFLEMNKKPIIIHTLEHFENNPEIEGIVVVCIENWINYLKDLLYKFRIEKVVKIVPGGVTGQLSIYNGLAAINELVNTEDDNIVLIHDGVRPLIGSQLISENIACVKKHGSAITTAIVKETFILVDDNGMVETVANRDQSRVAKAPQSFYLKDILEAHEKAQKENITDFIDSCTMMRYYGKALYTLNGPVENIKITTPDDFYTMRVLLETQENAQIYLDTEVNN
ncbi:IspD/TarI family cytidylyltransferase [Clostridium sp.]|uniref:IspD/TarI family cytidylyltransferase n=1 Tax=Clostridium sp. TaxID=1506 RepID=UPI001A491645|nr:IspD/TarI family cytidylyltransferase [Clostridium sp.]MBK5237373.1 2-C-methyl-D-erythritol 4-phosphate cytidylyltransferase [Clostridium sp.]